MDGWNESSFNAIKMKAAQALQHILTGLSFLFVFISYDGQSELSPNAAVHHNFSPLLNPVMT